MNLSQTELYIQEEDYALEQQIKIAKFKNYAKEKFASLVKYNIDHIPFIRNCEIHYKLNLPKEIEDFFINIKYAHFFWLAKTPILIDSEEHIKSHPELFPLLSSYTDIKKYYSKWIKQKNDDEKFHMASSIVEMVERNYDHYDFLSLIFYATILQYEKRLFSPEKSIAAFNKIAAQVFSLDIPAETKSKLLYLVNLYSGFAYLKLGNIEDANKKFNESKTYNKNALTPIFYEGFMLLANNDYKAVFEIIRTIINYDTARFKFALYTGSEGYFNFFIKNTFLFNIFAEERFSPVLEDIRILIETSYDENKVLLTAVYEKVINLENLKDDNKCDVAIGKEIDFLQNILEKYKDNRNLLIIYLAPNFREKFNRLIKNIENGLKQFYQDSINKKISVYDNQIKKIDEKLNKLLGEAKSNAVTYKLKLAETIKKAEAAYNDRIKELENRIDSLPSEDKYNPNRVFRDTIIFASLIAVMIFIIGGFASGYSVETSDTITKSIFSSGLKWGGISFILGVLVAFFSSANTVWERSDVKQRLIKQIGILKAEKEEHIRYLKQEVENQKLSTSSAYNKKVKFYKEDLAKIEKERSEELEELQINARIEIDERLKLITSLYINY